MNRQHLVGKRIYQKPVILFPKRMKTKCYRITRKNNECHYIATVGGMCVKAPHEVKYMKGWGLQQIRNFCRSSRWTIAFYAESYL